jgi:hypothetical protein
MILKLKWDIAPAPCHPLPMLRTLVFAPFYATCIPPPYYHMASLVLALAVSHKSSWDAMQHFDYDLQI